MTRQVIIKIILLIFIVIGAVALLMLIKKPIPDPGVNIPNTPNPKPKLTLEMLKNADYDFQGQKIKLVNGTYLLKPLPGESQSDYYVKLDEDHVVFGDLNNDGLEDAVVILTSRSGGTGVFSQLTVVINNNGLPLNVANEDLGDRAQINSLKIISSTISIDVTSWNSGQETRQTLNYELLNNKLQPL